MSNNIELDPIIESMQQESQNIQANRNDRNAKYESCMNDFKQFLKRETQQLQNSQPQNQRNKALISQAFENSFERIMNSTDITLRKIKHTYCEKKQFWNNVIKLNANLNDIELKKQFYQQMRTAAYDYEDAIRQQKDRRRSYQVLVGNNQKKQQLKDFQKTNKALQEKVAEGTNTLKEWHNLLSKGHKLASYPASYQYQTIITVDKYMHKPPLPNGVNSKYASSNLQLQDSTLFLNNFTKKR